MSESGDYERGPYVTCSTTGQKTYLENTGYSFYCRLCKRDDRILSFTMKHPLALYTGIDHEQNMPARKKKEIEPLDIDAIHRNRAKK